HSVKSVTSNSKEFSALLSFKEFLMISNPGNPPGARQLPESNTRHTAGDVRRTTRFGAVSFTGFVHHGILPATGRSDPLNLSGTPRLRIIFKNGGTALNHWIDDPPSLLNVIPARK